MRPIPTDFHLGPLQIHTYGIGLAITFYVAFRFFERRLAQRGIRTDWVGTMFIWTIVAAIVGARAMHVVSNLSFYSANPGDIVAIWHGGLSSFGGLLLAVPVAIFVTKRLCPELAVLKGLDIVAPVLMAAWSLGRLLGPQLMVAGGGHATSAWYGMYYASQVGRRVPVPVFQSLEDGTICLLLLWIERSLDQRVKDGHPPYPVGLVTAVAMILWGVARSLDERFLLGDGANLGSMLTQIAGVCLVVGGTFLAIRWWRQVTRLTASLTPQGDVN